MLRVLASVPHMAGTDQDYDQAKVLKENFMTYGLDDAKVVPYEVLLSFPNMTVPNKVHLLDRNGAIIRSTSGLQTPLYSPEENSSFVAPNFNAYSGSGPAEVFLFID